MFTNHLKRFLPLCLSVLLWLVSATTAFAADIKSVSGTVTDELGDPIIGAVIKELNTQNTTITNIDGEFNMKLVSKKPVLEITYLGYTTVKVPVDKAKLDISMTPQANDLEEVVVVAYGQQKKVTVTGSVASVGGAELKKSSEPNLTAALAGKLPGLTTIQKSAAPGEDDATMFLRGAATTNGTSPLILVDGIPRTSMSDIDPNEVASLSVLKDASSTAVFGVRGANGVILITTKRGEEGKVNVHGQVQYSMQKFGSWPKQRSSSEFVKLVNEAYKNDGNADYFSKEHIDLYSMWDNGGRPTQARYRELYPDGRYRNMTDEQLQYFFPNNDWSDFFLKDHSDMVQANVNVSGGTKKLKYFVSAGYVYQGGMYKTESSQKLGYDPSARMNRYNIRVNLDYKFNDWISASLDLSSYIKKYDAPASDTSDGDQNEVQMRSGIITSRPTDAGPVAIDGLFFRDPSDPSNLLPVAPGSVVHGPDITYLQSSYALLNRSGQRMTVNSAVNGVGTLNIDLGKLTPGLSMRGVVAFETYAHSYTLSRKKWSAFTYELEPTDMDTPVLILREATDPTDGKVIMSRADQTNWFVNLQAQINYNRTFNRVHNVTGMLLAQRDEKEDVLGSIPFKMIGLSGRFTYNYDSRYLAEFNFGYNGSEQFAPKNRFGFFPAFSLGWVASSEKFMAPLYESGALTKLKFRASLGKVGNDVLGSDRFLYLNNISQFTFGSSAAMDHTNWYGGMHIPPSIATNGQTIREILLGNDQLRWETAWKQNYGVDITAFRNFDLSFDYFIEHRSDILMGRNTIPQLSGLSSSQLPRSNFGKIDNKGFEVQASYHYAINKDIHLSLSGNFSYAKNIVKEADEVALADDYAYPIRTTGFSLGQCWGYLIDYTNDPERGLDGTGFFNTQEQLDKFLAHTKYNTTYKPRVGDFVYKDISPNEDGTIGDGEISVKDLAPIGYSSLLPRITYGATLSGDLYGFDFSVMIQGTGQYTRSFGGPVTFEFYGNTRYYADFCDNRWTAEKYESGQKITHPAISASGGSSHEANSYYVMDASYIRLKNVQLGYTIPKKVTKKIGMNNVRIFVSADNLKTWTNMPTKIIDPEQSNFYSYPLMKTYTAGITVDL
ncbi:MAG: TonB-dependent receptor [Muribaculum sp.]|nr:TonB-dependent receptor [Muribaculaceae bacterium]MCM1080726.1 TonB-dependent receptor [Muribaculum sp.]